MSEPPRLQKIGHITKETSTIDKSGKETKTTTISAVFIGYHDLKKLKKRKIPLTILIWRYTQWVIPPLRDGAFYDYRNIKKMHNLLFKIKTGAFWLASPTFHGDKQYILPFHDQVTRYYEYLNMKAKFYLGTAIFALALWGVISSLLK